jgi:cyclopropane-fatty-acyl-phospholipid synthase
MKFLLDLADRGRLPDPLVRLGIHRLNRRRLRREGRGGAEAALTAKLRFAEAMRASPVALETRKANEQHYELPPEFFREVLGSRMKYSGCFWPPGVVDLDAAEEAMLRLACERAGLADGQEILELGCGWGAITLWMAEQYPKSRILAMSNSAPQRDHILAAAEARGAGNIEVATADINHFDPGRRFDRVVSVEMFEHVRNWPLLMSRIAGWLKPEGRVFVHVFTHREFAYPYEIAGEDDWMGRHFFTGGMMPSDDLFGQRQHLERLPAGYRAHRFGTGVRQPETVKSSVLKFHPGLLREYPVRDIRTDPGRPAIAQCLGTLQQRAACHHQIVHDHDVPASGVALLNGHGPRIPLADLPAQNDLSPGEHPAETLLGPGVGKGDGGIGLLPQLFAEQRNRRFQTRDHRISEVEPLLQCMDVEDDELSRATQAERRERDHPGEAGSGGHLPFLVHPIHRSHREERQYKGQGPYDQPRDLEDQRELAEDFGGLVQARQEGHVPVPERSRVFHTEIGEPIPKGFP